MNKNTNEPHQDDNPDLNILPYDTWDDLKRALDTMKPRSKLFELIKNAIMKRGNWQKKRPTKSERKPKR